MKTRLLNLWEALQTSYWFIPTLMAGGAILFSFIMISIDERVFDGTRQTMVWIYRGTPQGARALLSTISGSMITVAGVVFSITIVALTLASSQFGPRLLRNFMRDKGNQIVLGTFIGTFLYCLLIIRTIRDTGEQQFVPHLSVTFGVLFALASIGVLIYFFHHVATSIQADNVIRVVYNDLRESMNRLFPQKSDAEEKPQARNQTGDGIPKNFTKNARTVAARRSGYLQAIDTDGLMKIATDNDLVLRLTCRPGKYIAVNSTIIQAVPSKRVDEEVEKKLENTFIVGNQRSPEQDMEFAIHQIVEIALRALSPGINDPYTAISCIDWLSAALSELTERQFPPQYHYDADDRLRIVADVTTFEGILDAAYEQIRQYGQSSVAVMIRLMEALETIAARAKTTDQQKAIRLHANIIEQTSRQSVPSDKDRKDVQEHHQAVIKVLEDLKKLDSHSA